MRKGFGNNSEALDESKGLQKIIAASKTSGALNLSNRQLQEVCSWLVGTLIQIYRPPLACMRAACRPKRVPLTDFAGAT
jgi:hypothetical protein